jgi:hypothetical protein
MSMSDDQIMTGKPLNHNTVCIAYLCS